MPTRNAMNHHRRFCFNFALVLLIAATGCAGIFQGSRMSRGDTQYTGTWEGTLDGNEFSANMTLVLDRTEEAWTGSVELQVGLDVADGPVTDFTSEGNTFSFQTTIAGGDVMVTGTVERDEMTGSFVVYQEGSQVDEGTFRCVRKL